MARAGWKYIDGVEMITEIRLKELLDYDPETGVFTWKFREPISRGNKNFNSRFGGKKAGNYRINTDGHKSVQLLLDGKGYQANRLVILYVDGYLPDKTLQVDHKNGDGWDNRYLNLRVCTASQNSCNRSRKSPSGLPKGVQKISKRFRAMIRLQGKNYHLGMFDTPEEAHKAYCEAAVKLHGEFAKLS